MKGNKFNIGNIGITNGIMAYTAGWSCILAMASSILCLLICGYAFKNYFAAKNEIEDPVIKEEERYGLQGSSGIVKPVSTASRQNPDQSWI